MTRLSVITNSLNRISFLSNHQLINFYLKKIKEKPFHCKKNSQQSNPSHSHFGR